MINFYFLFLSSLGASAAVGKPDNGNDDYCELSHDDKIYHSFDEPPTIVLDSTGPFNVTSSLECEHFVNFHFCLYLLIYCFMFVLNKKLQYFHFC